MLKTPFVNSHWLWPWCWVAGWFGMGFSGCQTSLAVEPTPRLVVTQPVDGYRGIWYSVQPTKDQFGYKYSGGLATYPQQQTPNAVYAAAAQKTFFCYGGTVAGQQRLLHIIAYFDHRTQRVSQPRMLLDKETADAHDNPTLQIDDTGHLWIFSSAHGTARPAYLHRSRKPYDITEFELIWTTNFSYTQPWFIPGRGFLFLHTRYHFNKNSSSIRQLYWMTSATGRDWSEPQPLALIDQGSDQISWAAGDRIATAFNFHPKPKGLDARTNLYYLETHDFGGTWQTITGETVALPLTQPQNPTLVHDYQQEDCLVYLKDMQFDDQGQPVLLYLTSKSSQPGPIGEPRRWHTARWNGQRWDIFPVTTSDHNYDFGSLAIFNELVGQTEVPVWQLLAPIDPGPQPGGTGGTIMYWQSRDRGQSWQRIRTLSTNTPFNRSYLRRPWLAHPDFWMFWADGNPFAPSASSLYFTNQKANCIWRLPPSLQTDDVAPEVIATWE